MQQHISTYAEHNKNLLEKIDGLMDRVLKDVEGKTFKEHLDSLHQAMEAGNQAVLMNLPYAVHGGTFPPSPFPLHKH
jgi:hypothetical protein